MELKHTKGNLFIENPFKTGDCWTCIIYVNIDKRTGKSNPHQIHGEVLGTTKEEAEANAKLIAAAPKMLQGLIDIKSALIDSGKYKKGSMFINSIQLLIDKATSET